ncbi:MAG: PIN domain-containing protein [Actinobacteria bacterium]|nr:PIN domain-containing protein [Actinomycetota bacterium]
MILPDVNVLIYAFRVDTEEHVRAAAWLEGLAARGGELALCDAVVSGFLRIVTHPKVISPPTPIEDALRFVRWLIEAPGVHWLGPAPSVWDTFERIADTDRGIRGNLVPDAYLAALCLAHGTAIGTADRGFARFDGLRRVDPLA